MQSLVVYGRLLARAVFTGINNEFTQHSQFANAQTWSCAQPSAQARDLHLVTASSGFSKSHSPSQVYKKWCFGDDACFSAAHKLADVIGVADGVGGWRTYGIDPSQFPRLLMNTCERIVREGQFRPQAPVGIIAAGYAEMLENKKPLIGSCTACVVSLYREQRTMYTANLGDSGFLLIREGEVIHRSEEQQHYFNTPFQLSMAPTTLQGLVLSDSPESAESSTIPVQEGDLILLGTDGLFDNMNEEMILLHLSKLKDFRRESMQQVANSLCQEAHELAFDPDFMSPFALNANANGIDIKGGKPDDITVMLSRVTEGDPYS